MTWDPAPLSGLLAREPGDLGGLMKAAQQVEALDRALRASTTEAWVQSVRVANVRGDTLVLFADNASALVPLRYRREAILKLLREKHGLAATRIEVKVRPGR